MKRIRINNDLAIEWSILTNGQPMSIEGREIKVEISNTRGYSIKPAVTAQGNTLFFALKGAEQTSLGMHRIKATDTTDGAMNTLDIADAFELVPHTFMEGGEDAEGMNVRRIELTSNIDKLIPDTLVMRKLTDLLYRVKFSALDYDFANKYFKSHYAPVVGGCSVVRKGNKIGRNLDWYYNNEVEFIVETDASLGRHAVRGFAGTISALTKDKVARGVNGEQAKILPFRMTDGVNDAGVYASVNIVNANATRSIADAGTTPDIEQRDEVCIAMIVRYILDNFATAQEACEYIRDYVRVYAPVTDGKKNEVQVLVADKGNTYVLSFEGTQTRILEDEFNGVLTNFRLGDTILVDGKYEIDGSNIEDYGNGIERANEALDMMPYASVDEIMVALHYTHAYDLLPINGRLTDFVGINGTTIHSTQTELRHIKADATRLFNRTDRSKGDVWHTTHTIVYDLDTMQATYSTQEINDGNSYEGAFDFPADVVALARKIMSVDADALQRIIDWYDGMSIGEVYKTQRRIIAPHQVRTSAVIIADALEVNGDIMDGNGLTLTDLQREIDELKA